MSAAATSVSTSIGARARDALLLESAERAVRALTPEQAAAVRKQHDAAMRRASVADDLSDDRNIAVAFVLYREAVTLLVGAVLAARDPHADISDLRIGAAFEKLDALVRDGQVPAPPPELAQAKQVLMSEETLAFDRASSEDLMSKRGGVEATIRWLSDLVESRTLGEIRASRIARLAAVGAIVLAALTWLGFRVARPSNIALHKPVTASDRHPLSTAPVDNSGFTNGEIEGNYGIHTNHAAPGAISWVIVDLLAPHRIATVKIYNRKDGYFSDGQPYTLEFSEDGTNYTAVDRRAEPFSALSPWVYKAGGASARYIRITSANYVALTEIEVSPQK